MCWFFVVGVVGVGVGDLSDELCFVPGLFKYLLFVFKMCTYFFFVLAAVVVSLFSISSDMAKKENLCNAFLVDAQFAFK